MVAIASNGLFILYGLSADIHPVIILHMILLPINVMKLQNIRPEACAAEPRPLAMAPEKPRMTTAARLTTVAPAWSGGISGAAPLFLPALIDELIEESVPTCPRGCRDRIWCQREVIEQVQTHVPEVR